MGLFIRGWAVFALLASIAVAQGAERVIGYCDVADPRTRCTGMKTALEAARRPGLRFERFDLRQPKTFRPEQWDAVLFSSYIEMTPGWTAFVQRESSRVLALAERGGLVVFFARYRKSDTGEASDVPRVPRIEPPGWKLTRKKGNPGGLYVDLKSHPLWDGVGGRGGRTGVAMVKNTRMANRKAFGVEVFSRWRNRNLKVGVWSAQNRRGDALALHGAYGSRGGEVWYLQLLLDKVDGPASDKSEAVSRSLFKNLVGLVAKRKRVGTAAPSGGRRSNPVPVTPDPIPNPPSGTGDGVQPAPIPVTPKPTPRSVVAGRVFLDLNGDGRPQPGEAGYGGAELSDLVRTTRTGGDGSFRFEASAGVSRTYVLDLPDRYELSRADATWWTTSRLAQGGQPARDGRADFGLRPVADAQSARVLAARIAPPRDAAAVDRVVRDLIALIERRRPQMLLLLLPKFSDALERRLDFGLRDAVVGAQVDVRRVSDQGRQRSNELLPGRITRQPLRSARTMAGAELLVLAAPESGGRAPSWNRWLQLHPGADLFVSGVALGESQRRALSGGVVVEPGAQSRITGRRVELAPFSSDRESWLEISLRRGSPPELRLEGMDPNPLPTAGGENPKKPEDSPPGPVLPRHPLIEGSLEEALRAAGGG